MIEIIENGIRITFKNGWVVTIMSSKDHQCSGDGSDAEVGIHNPNGKLDVFPNVDIDNIARLLFNTMRIDNVYKRR